MLERKVVSFRTRACVLYRKESVNVLVHKGVLCKNNALTFRNTEMCLYIESQTETFRNTRVCVMLNKCRDLKVE